MKQIASLREELTAEVFAHEVIQQNPYTKWFKLGEANTAQVIDLVVQFSVFSNHFIPLEAKRMVNAATEEEEKEARAILGSEIGVSIDATTGKHRRPSVLAQRCPHQMASGHRRNAGPGPEPAWQMGSGQRSDP